MALYLGEEKVSAVLHKEQRCLKGKINSDENGVITFPKLEFTPTLIAVWNIGMHDHTKNEEYEEGWIPYTYNGVMVFAVKYGDTWVSQCPFSNSGQITISNASYLGNALKVVDGRYQYNLGLRSSTNDFVDNTYGNAFDISNEEFNYAIYG